MYSYRMRLVATGLSYNAVNALIRILTLGAFALGCLGSPTLIFENRKVFVVLAVLEVSTPSSPVLCSEQA